ncbi:hypothetical protein HAX54_033777, partial [Datura stramonium]|nr:hypothetical protein [Datura stramonium]
MTTNNKVHFKGNVPFSWEKKPGVSKITPTKNCATGEYSPKVLPPPPCKSKVAPLHHLQIPLPPCTSQPPAPPLSRSSSRRIFKKQDNHDDPFYIAYKECTKSSRKCKDDFGFEMKNKNKNNKKKN